MSQVSKRFVSKPIQERLEILLGESFQCFHTAKEHLEFMNSLLTSTEKVMLSKRLAIAYLLSKGHTYRDINQILKVSNPTIRSVELLLRYKGNGLKSAIQKVQKIQTWKKFFDEIATATLSLYGYGKGNDWKSTKAFEIRQQRKTLSPLA
ncbi:hypothetical protein A3D77_00815 [Candidatus Gottesmanbacteria bacterium RIFCSPHIGHO2_02_FULL_39_11]|uniref:Uncharacterized protein n=1 Tax=Candidatus Gottesmanbacteria bacterium RIFCSPHIGHO2_02_FULL_39_11 TaxID=1798382 RepID=A0A1F5ZNW4_9BACT|nr:MAG: hypothetical protein A3D77_00815 [Candidatus Gottesmanbacteria bacterium RIFCSPHIGHO2_02_FULL_39_11]